MTNEMGQLAFSLPFLLYGVLGFTLPFLTFALAFGSGLLAGKRQAPWAVAVGAVAFLLWLTPHLVMVLIYFRRPWA